MINFSAGSQGNKLLESNNLLNKIQRLTGSGTYSIRNSINELNNEYIRGSDTINSVMNGNPY